MDLKVLNHVFSAQNSLSEKKSLPPLKKTSLVEYYQYWLNNIENKEKLTGHLHLGLFNESYPECSLKKAQEEMVSFVLGYIKSNSICLDIGCGLCGPTLMALQNNRSLRVDAIDLLEANLAKSKKLIFNNDLDRRCKLIYADAHQLPFSDNSYDYAWAFESLMHMNQQTVLQEVYRVLKNQGILKFCDFCIIGKMSEEEAKFIEEEELMFLLNKNDYSILLKKIGFKNIEIFDLTDLIYPNFILFYPESKQMRHLIEEKKIGYIFVQASAMKIPFKN